MLAKRHLGVVRRRVSRRGRFRRGRTARPLGRLLSREVWDRAKPLQHSPHGTPDPSLSDLAANDDLSAPSQVEYPSTAACAISVTQRMKQGRQCRLINRVPLVEPERIDLRGVQRSRTRTQFVPRRKQGFRRWGDSKGQASAPDMTPQPTSPRNIRDEEITLYVSNHGPVGISK